MITVKNTELAPVINFLAELPLRGRASRGRTKLNELFAHKHEQLLSDIELLKEEVGISEEVTAEVQESEEYQAKIAEYNSQFTELLSDKVLVDYSEYQHFLSDLIEGLYDCEVAFQGQDSLIYDLLLEQLEKEKDSE